mgnify:CR=1 FL=1
MIYKNIIQNKIKTLKFFLNFLIVVCLILLFIFLSFNNFFDSKDLNPEGIQNCVTSRYEINSSETTTFKLENIPIFPEFENFKCLSKITNIQTTNIPDTYKPNIDERNIVYVSTSIIFFKVFNYIFNLFLIFLTLYFFENFKARIFLLYLSGNLLIHSLFNSYEPFIKVLIPFTHPEEGENQYLFNALFLFIYVLKSKSNNLFIFTLYISTFFIPDFLSFLIILFYVFKKSWKEDFNNHQKILLKLLPAIFLFLRFIFSLFPQFKLLWNFPAMRFFQGETKYYDMLWTLESMKCIHNPNYFDNSDKSCRNLTGGFLDDYLYITTNPEFTTFVLIAILFVLLLWIYFLLVEKYPESIFFITILFLSSSFNFLTYLGNIDLIFFSITFLLFHYSNRMYLLKIFILFFFTLFNTHPLGGLIGYSIYLLKNKLYKYFVVSSLFSISSIILIINEIDNIQGNLVGTIEASYGIQYFISRFTDINLYFGLALFIFITFIISNFINVEYPNLNRDFKINNGYIEIVLYWFLFTSLFFNNSYRLVIFSVLFLLIFRQGSNLIKIFTLLFMLFSVLPTTIDYYFQILFWVIKVFSFSFLFTFITGYFIQDIKSLVTKTILSS